MGFWIFMLTMSLLIPLSMIVCGVYYTKGGPRKINGITGYRTYMSMKNKDTWSFAHHYCGKLWRTIGWVMLPLSAGAMFLVFGKKISVVGWFCVALVAIQTVSLIVPLFFVEKALKTNFDKNGNRIV